MGLPLEITIGEKYGPAMSILHQNEADTYFEYCVQHAMRCRVGMKRSEAEAMERCNLAYYAGYYDSQTRRRVEKLFSCAHPIFGSIEENGEPTADQSLFAGFIAARRKG